MSSIHLCLFRLVFAAAVTPLAAVTITQFNTSHFENFDTLAVVTDSVVPAGWQFSETGSSANTTYGAGTGSSTTGNTYSFGSTGSTERALGSVRTTGVAATFGSVIANETGSSITELTVQFTGEQWRLGALGRLDRLDFGYSTDATSVATGVWFDVDALDFTAPVTAGVVGALDGNAIENQFLLSHTITGLNVASGTSVWLRWVDFEAAGSDDGLAIDNFSIIAVRTVTDPEPQNVPESLPMSVIVAAMGSLLALARWRSSAAMAIT
jgi:uncharacterized protein